MQSGPGSLNVDHFKAKCRKEFKIQVKNQVCFLHPSSEKLNSDK